MRYFIFFKDANSAKVAHSEAVKFLSVDGESVYSLAEDLPILVISCLLLNYCCENFQHHKVTIHFCAGLPTFR